jgi:hypothetical protein
MNNQGRYEQTEQFRVALGAVERRPSDEAIAELRLAAAPILDRLRAEYRAAGHTDDDGAAMFRWLRAKLAERDSIATRSYGT